MTAIELIAAERERQVAVEGWTPEHDDKHGRGELLSAAQSYAFAVPKAIAIQRELIAMDGIESGPMWPWEPSWWKPSLDPIRNLVKAGALIAAEIDRLQRVSK